MLTRAETPLAGMADRDRRRRGRLRDPLSPLRPFPRRHPPPHQRGNSRDSHRRRWPRTFSRLESVSLRRERRRSARDPASTIVLTGASLSFANATAVGWRAFAIIVDTMTAAMASAWIFGRMLKLAPGASMLIGAGTAICGNSAIIAVAPLIDAEDRDVMLSVGAINVLGLALMFVSPFAGGFSG